MNPKDVLCETPCEEIDGIEEVRVGEPIAGKRVMSILEALLFVSESPLTLDRLQMVLEGYSRKELQETLNGLIDEYRRRDGGLEIVEVASGYQVRTRSEFSQWIRKLKQQKPVRLSRSSLETLAIIAYNQPLTRAEIENIRGVDSMGVLGSLVEKQLIRILGRKEVPGRPLIYGTTPEFLEVFGLKNLKSLPTLKEIEEMLGAKASEQEEQIEAPGKGGGSEVLPPETDQAMAEAVPKPEMLEGADEEHADTEEETEAAGQEITTEEVDEILKSARSKSRSIKRELGMMEDTEEPSEGKDSEGPSTTEQ